MFSFHTKPWVLRVAGAMAALLLLWAVAWLAVPWLVRSQGERLGSEALGRQVTIGRVEFQPWSLELTIHDLAIAAADGQGTQLAVRRIHADADAESLLRLGPVLDALEIDGPVLHLTQRSAGHYDIDDILARLTASGDQAPQGKPWRFALYNIAVHGGAVDFADDTVQRTHTVRDLELGIPFLSNLESQRAVKVLPHLAFKLNGSAFESTAEATPFLASRKTEARLRLTGFDLAPFQDYLPRSLPARLQAGVLDVDLALAFEQHPGAALHLRGSVQARGVRLAGRHGHTLLDLESADARIADMEPLAGRLQLASAGAAVRALAIDGGAADAPVPQLSGRLAAEDLELSWQAGATVARLSRVALDGLALDCPPQAACAGAGVPGIAMRSKSSLAEIKVLRAEEIRLDTRQRALQVGRVVLTQPRALVERDAQGRWMAEHWLGGAPEAAPAAGGPAAPWNAHFGAVEVDGGAIALRDALPERPVVLSVAALRLRLADFAPLGAQPAPLELAARIAAGRTEPGRLEYTGTLRMAPLAVQGRVLAQRLPLHALEPYVAQALNVRVLRADGSFQGTVRYAAEDAGPALRVQGDAALDDLRVRSALLTRPSGAQAARVDRRLAPPEDLLHWKSLGLRGVDVELAPGRATQVQVRETALSDFFARVIVQDNGRINLQDLLRQPESAAGPSTATAAPPAPPPSVRFGAMALTGGTVRFSDYFIQPNYSADLSELTGRLSAFSSEPAAAGAAPAMADLELRGRAEGTATLEITGQLNPLARPLALAITGKMRDLELPPLSPYTIKYAGHGIERGKLSMDVNYRIQPDGQLTASNKLVLQQLTFGEPVEGAPASLPVRLATALLADRQGVIDLDLPISGSLNDPEFRLGPVIFKIIGNLVMKAVTAPFALLSSALGGAAEPGTVAFAPGSAQLDDAARASLDKVAQALIDRPALTLTVVGEARLADEREAWKQAQLQQWLLAQKRRNALRSGQDGASVQVVTAEEAPVLLKEVYLRADIAKPRNLVSMAKDLPQSEMQALLLASMAVPEDAMRALAVARGVAVRDYLAARQVPSGRLFLGAEVTRPEGEGWSPRARLTLAAK